MVHCASNFTNCQIIFGTHYSKVLLNSFRDMDANRFNYKTVSSVLDSTDPTPSLILLRDIPLI
jgi:hypothetical protein